MKNIIILFLCLLTGCTTLINTTTPSYPVLSWQERQAQLQKLSHWQAEGAMSIRHANQTTAFSFQWQQNQSHYELQFFAPLGLASLHVSGDANQVVLWQSTTQKITAKTPEALMVRQLGYAVPVTCLYYWIRGLPDPHLPMTKVLDANNHLSELQQQNWIIHFLDFKTINGIDLPTQITLVNEPLHVKIVITRWNLS